MVAMLDYECLNCCWVNAHILDETIVDRKNGDGHLKTLDKNWCFSPHLHLCYNL